MLFTVYSPISQDTTFDYSRILVANCLFRSETVPNDLMKPKFWGNEITSVGETDWSLRNEFDEGKTIFGVENWKFKYSQNRHNAFMFLYKG